jgi:PPOX class probable F420-dependent enzyme
MSALVPDSLRDLFERPIVVALATVNPDGQPQVTPVWCSFDGTHVWINTARGRQKDKNLSKRAKATILAIDPQDSFHWIEIRGEVVEETEEGAVEHIEQLSRKYVNQAYYGEFNPAEKRHQETRVIYKIKPLKVLGK